MPKENQRGAPAERAAAQEEKFRTFFSTTVAQVPAEMTRRDSELDERPKGLLARLFHREKPAAPSEAPAEKEDTGELVLDRPAEEPEADLELAIQPEGLPQQEIKLPRQSAPVQRRDIAPAERRAAEPAPASAPAPAPAPVQAPEPEPAPQPAPPPQPEPQPEPAPVPAPQPDPEPEQGLQIESEPEPEAPPVQAAQPEPVPVQNIEPAPAPQPAPPPAPRAEAPRKARRTPRPSAAPRRMTPQEVQETQKLDELRALLDQQMGARPSAPLRAAPAEPARPPLVFAQEKQPAPRPVRPAPAPAPEVPPVPQPPAPAAPPAPDAPAPEVPPLRLFGAEEQPHPSKEDSMSLPLLGLEEQPAPAPEWTAPPPPADLAAEAQAGPDAPDADAPEAPTWRQRLAERLAPPPAEQAAPATPEEAGERLRRMGASLTLRCVVSGLLALVLLQLGLTAGGLLPPLGGLDPVAAPAAFYGVNLLLLLAAMAVAYSVLRDGLAGLRGTPSAETMPALAAMAALVQAAVALFNAPSYASSNMTLLSGIAALGLCLALVGGRVMLAAVQGGHELAACGVPHQGAARVRDKELVRTLAQGLEEKDPWVLHSSPVEWDAAFLDQSFGPRASERRARKTAYILLGAALFSGLVFLVFGAGVNGAAAAAASMLCMGAPLSSTLVAGVAALRLQRTAGAVGAVVPGWAATEELGGVDTIQLDADDLFGPESVNLEDIRIFKGGRIDRAILYTASVLNQGCSTLRGLFRQIIEDRTDILFPVKDLEVRRGQGFAAWCDNNHILLGTRAYLESEGVPLPEPEYEAKHSQNGALQILYLAVSGNLHAMFVLRYVGGRNAARSLAVLQRENIRLLVSCQDPSLTARHIAEAYRLPEGMVTVLTAAQCDALAAAPAPSGEGCCLLHLKGLASLTGGLAAAETAQAAETSATTVQLASVWLSVAIGLLLTSAGSVGGLSVAAVLMYQAAWSALSIAVCALKAGR